MYIRTYSHIHVYINAGPLPFKSQTIAYIMKRSAIYIKVQSKYTCVGGSACIIYYSSIEIYIRSGLANKLSQIKASLKYY